MPNIQSAKKRVQVSERNRERNIAIRSAVRTAIKKALLAAKANTDASDVSKTAQNAYSVIDRAVLKGILHKNTGARYKSRLMKAAQTV
ncbi:MAG: 30S ribosomal protein S20 [Vampirovibrionales bacterium]|nr:30S ribosomal protein S20 [Vampirovibrionales bacterium]